MSKQSDEEKQLVRRKKIAFTVSRSRNASNFSFQYVSLAVHKANRSATFFYFHHYNKTSATISQWTFGIWISSYLFVLLSFYFLFKYIVVANLGSGILWLRHIITNSNVIKTQFRKNSRLQTWTIATLSLSKD